VRGQHTRAQAREFRRKTAVWTVLTLWLEFLKADLKGQAILVNKRLSFAGGRRMIAPLGRGAIMSFSANRPGEN
jgi:hypothetical protein